MLTGQFVIFLTVYRLTSHLDTDRSSFTIHGPYLGNAALICASRGQWTRDTAPYCQRPMHPSQGGHILLSCT